ncbi:MAG: hypothetical protein KatS3mg119_2305 [Rhodothalassiaceae bacterium]|nr:MAG: hypothetical protein KatS3mg119_2305 [Rhodothalassiaceae bacterium]
MADATDKEPTMEEILASIRRIISEEAEEERARADEEQADEPAAAEAPEDGAVADEAAPEPEDPQAAADALFAEEEPEPEPEPEAPAEEAPADDVFELTEPAEEEPEDAFAAAVKAAEERAGPAEEPAADEDAIVSPPTELKVAASFAELSALLIKSADGGAPTLEGLVREMLKPMMRAWLDENLPRIVEDMVAQEIARLSARARRR